MGIGSRNVLINKPLLMNTLVQAFLIERMKDSCFQYVFISKGLFISNILASR